MMMKKRRRQPKRLAARRHRPGRCPPPPESPPPRAKSPQTKRDSKERRPRAPGAQEPTVQTAEVAWSNLVLVSSVEKTLTHYAVGEPVGPKRAENKPDKALRQRCVLCVNTHRHSRLHRIDRSRSQSGSRTNSYDCMAIRINRGIARGE